jgi:two-component system phosphate regulon sensor histidine kinase PhoR
VRLGRDNGTATIEVQDTGMGIPPEDRDRLFERLYRTKGATAMQIPGTGLGLSIVKAIVDAHGGDIDVQSEVGAGTTFRVELPLNAGGGNGSDPAKDGPE